MKKQPFIPIDFFDKEGRYIKQTVPSHLQPFWFTFSKDSIHAKKCVKIWAESWEEARERMNNFYGKGRWAFQYDTECWMHEDGITRAEKHELSEIEIKPLIKE